MVESQLRGGGVTNAAILSAMRSVPRELFVADSRRDLAYADDIQWLGAKNASRFLAAPVTLAKLLKLAEIVDTDRVLDIGAASGYSTAVIAKLALSVVGLEQDVAMASTTAANLASLGFANAAVVSGEISNLVDGQFDVIVVQGSLDRVPDGFLAKLADHGRLVTLIRTGSVCVAHLLVKSAGTVTTRAEFSAFLPPLSSAKGPEDFVF